MLGFLRDTLSNDAGDVPVQLTGHTCERGGTSQNGPENHGVRAYGFRDRPLRLRPNWHGEHRYSLWAGKGSPSANVWSLRSKIDRREWDGSPTLTSGRGSIVKTFWECVRDLRRKNKIPRRWRATDLIPFLWPKFTRNTIQTVPANQSVDNKKKIQGNYIKRGYQVEAFRVARGLYTLKNDPQKAA